MLELNANKRIGMMLIGFPKNLWSTCNMEISLKCGEGIEKAQDKG